MPIPQLDANGFLPVGVHECTVAEVRTAFAGSPHRTTILDGFEDYLQRLRAINEPIELYVDGGYTTQKPEEPEDIDVIVDVTAVDLRTAPAALRDLLNSPAMKASYKVDPTARHDAMTANGDCREFFQYVREENRQKLGLPPNFRKGLLKLVGWQ